MFNFIRRFGVVAFVVVVAFTNGPTAAAQSRFVLLAPSDAEVIDPFRMPSGPYGAGNRGLEYGTSDGDRITAAATGNVSFAGPVAGSLFVSVDHGGGFRTTYGFVGSITTRVGRTVEAGDLVALADGPFHFTLRLHGTYVDPARFFGRWKVRARLVLEDGSLMGRRPHAGRSVAMQLAQRIRIDAAAS